MSRNDQVTNTESIGLAEPAPTSPGRMNVWVVVLAGGCP